MMRVWKYPLTTESEQKIKLPGPDPIFLSAQLQNGRPFLWALVETSCPLWEYTIYCYATNEPVPLERKHIGTVVLPDMTVWHYFVLHLTDF